MSTGKLIQLPRQRVLSSSIQAVAGAKLYAQQAGTSNPIVVYLDSGLTVPAPNPVVADAYGLLPALYVSPSSSSYKLRLTTSDGQELWTEDNIPATEPTQTVQDSATFRLIASSQIFTFDGEDSADPVSQTINFGLVRQNITETAVWSTTPSVTLGGSGDNRTLSVADFGANDSVTVRATITVGLVTYYDEVTVHRVRAGSDAITGLLTNEAHTLATDVDGVVTSYVGANGFFRVYYGATDVTASAAFTVVSQTNVNGTVNTADNDPVNGQVKGFYQITSLSADNGQLTMRASFSGLNIDKTFSVSKAKTGATGADGPAGADGTVAKLMRLTATSQVFTFDNAGNADPVGQSITFESIRTGISTATTWTTDPVKTLGGSGDTRTLSIAEFGTADSVKVTASSEGYSDVVTIVRVQDGLNGGVDGLSGFLTNEAHLVPADSDGVVSSWAGASGTFKVYSGATDVTTSSTFALTSSSNLTATINASTGAYSATDMAANVGTATFTATYDGTDLVKTFTVTKSIAGQPGADGADGAPGADGTDGERGPGRFYAGTGSSGTGYSLSSADATTWAGTLTNGVAAEAAAYVVANSSNGYIEPRDVVTIYESGVQSATRIYNGPRTTSYGAVVAAQWSSPVVEIIDGSLIVNGTVSADKVNVTDLASLSANLGTITAGTITLNTAGGYIRSGQSGFNTGNGFWLGNDGGTAKFSIGNSSGNLMYWDGTNLVVNPTSITLPTFSAAALSPWTSSYSNGTTQATTRTVSLTGGRSPFTYQWVVLEKSTSPTATDPIGIKLWISGGSNSATVTVGAGPYTNTEVFGTVQCTVIDADGRAAITSFDIDVTFGTPV